MSGIKRAEIYPGQEEAHKIAAIKEDVEILFIGRHVQVRIL